jgi:hypothetical protein
LNWSNPSQAALEGVCNILEADLPAGEAAIVLNRIAALTGEYVQAGNNDLESFCEPLPDTGHSSRTDTDIPARSLPVAFRGRRYKPLSIAGIPGLSALSVELEAVAAATGAAMHVHEIQAEVLQRQAAFTALLEAAHLLRDVKRLCLTNSCPA